MLCCSVFHRAVVLLCPLPFHPLVPVPPLQHAPLITAAEYKRQQYIMDSKQPLYSNEEVLK
jgi:hypothetical protein